MTAAIALVDLDDSLFQTRRKCPQSVAEQDLTVMARDRAGAPLSFATPLQMAWINWLRSSTVMVPVTARSVNALSRVDLSFDYAIAAHGGVLMRPGGIVCPQWNSRMGEAARTFNPALEGIAEQLRLAATRHGFEVNVRIIGEADLPLYVVAKHAHPEREAELHELACQVEYDASAGWTRHINGNNVAFLPPCLGKQHAVAHLLEELRMRHPGLPVIGLGDSLTDAPFLQLCDFAIMPTGSQLAAHALSTVDLAN